MALGHVAPNKNLTRELREVAKEAKRVGDMLRGINLMPRKFPVEAIDEICISLAGLVEGTAEGCSEPLNYARHMLPLVRRDHFHIEGDEPELQDEDDTYFSREHPLDQAIARLYVAVGTALDEYRAQAQDKYDDRVGPEETIELREDGTFSEISQKAQAVALEAQKERGLLSEMANVSSSNAENLRRQLQDSTNVAHSVQSQIRIRPIIARWYLSAGQALRALPDLMIKTADKMRFAADIGQIWHNEWSKFKGRLRALAYDQIRGLADALQATGERLKRNPHMATNSVERERDPDVVAAERRVKEFLLSGTPLPEELARKPEELIFLKTEGLIKRPEDMALLSNLQQLILKNQTVGKRMALVLGQLSNLTSLSVQGYGLNDLTPLAQLSNLTSLSIQVYQGNDLTPLVQLKNLVNLSVQADTVDDLTPLAQLTNLTSLSVQANKASDLTPLGQLKNLANLSVQADIVDDLNPLVQLTNLTSLSVQANKASDLTPLGQLKNLTNLSVQTIYAVDLTPIGPLSNLTSLSVQAYQGNDLAPLAQLTNLTSLSVQANNAKDLTPLGQLKNLTNLSVQANNAKDLTALGQLKNLTNLSVQANNVKDLTPLGQLKNLTNLSVQANNVKDLTALGQLKNLTNLSVQAKNANDFTPLGQLRHLTNLTLHAVQPDLSWMVDLQHLVELRMSQVEGLDLAPLARIASLKELHLDQVIYRNAGLLKEVGITLRGSNNREL